VVAIVISPVRSNFAVFYERHLAAISPTLSNEEACDVALPLLFAALSIRLDVKSSLGDRHFFIIHTGDIAEDARRVLELLGMHVVMIAPSFPQRFPLLVPGDIILFGSSPASLRGVSLAGAKLFNWNEDALNVVTNEPRIVGDVLQNHLSGIIPPLPLVSSSSRAPEDVIPPEFEYSPAVIFLHDSFYLIIGGVGSLGLQLAIWLYKVALSRRHVS
jgi:hypothetical protein